MANQNFVIHSSLEEPYPVPPQVTQEIFDDALSYIPTCDDIFVCSYPKSGTTWTTNALMLMRQNGAQIQDGLLQEKIPFLEFKGSEVVKKTMERPRIIKTHLKFKMIPLNNDAKYVFVARNPKDCFISYYFHKKGLKVPFNGDLDDFFKMFIDGKIGYGDYFDFVGEWYEESKNRPNICFLLYEDMKLDFKGQFLRIAEFLGGNLKQRLLNEQNPLLDQIFKGCSFKQMEKKSELYTPRNRKSSFLRKGQVGDWKNHLTEHQSNVLDEKLREAGKKYAGFDKLWDRHGCL